MNAFEILNERGFIEQMTHEDEIKQLFANEKVTFYTGFDPTAGSLTIGHFLTVMAMMHLQRAGHTPIVLLGAGTTMVGDPTGRNDMRKMMTIDEINENADCFKKQFSKYLDFENGSTIVDNNADWLLKLNYVELLREVGAHFSVNRMLTAEAFKARMEKGLSFLEFNYMIMQAYDFLKLNRKYGCCLQLGGNDQWSNIIAGVDLIRRVENKSAFGLTLKLLTTSDGKKMGKTQAGAIWIDPEKTTPYELFQYFRSVDDKDVEKLLSLMTFLPMKEVRELGALKDNEINKAKEILAFEVTKIIHSEEAAVEAQTAARALFYGEAEGGSIPTTEITKAAFNGSMDILTLLEKCELIPSRGEGRRLVQQGGVKVNKQKIDSFDHAVTLEDFSSNELVIQKGKKVFHKVVLID